jgi:hypothetical protein
VVSVEHVETPKTITVSVDMPLKLDEELENTRIKPEVAAEKKERVEETPLRLEEEPEDRDEEGVEGMKIGQGLRGRGGCL